MEFYNNIVRNVDTAIWYLTFQGGRQQASMVRFTKIYTEKKEHFNIQSLSLTSAYTV